MRPRSSLVFAVVAVAAGAALVASGLRRSGGADFEGTSANLSANRGEGRGEGSGGAIDPAPPRPQPAARTEGDTLQPPGELASRQVATPPETEFRPEAQPGEWEPAPVDDHIRGLLAAAGETEADFYDQQRAAHAQAELNATSISYAISVQLAGQSPEEASRTLLQGVDERAPVGALTAATFEEDALQILENFVTDLRAVERSVQSRRSPAPRDGVYRFRVAAERTRQAIDRRVELDQRALDLALRADSQLVGLLGSPQRGTYLSYLENRQTRGR